MTILTGLFLASPSGSSSRETVDDLLAVEPDRFPMLVRKRSLFASKLWAEYDLITLEAFADEAFFDHGPPPYRYKVVFAFSGPRLVVLAEKKRISEYIFTEIFARRIFPNFRRIAIFIDTLVHEFSNHESEYLITSLHGKYAAPDKKIRTMSLYGDEVTDSSIYRNNHALFNFHSCGVGRRLFDGLPRLTPPDDNEIVRLTTRGGIVTNLRSWDRAREISGVLNHILKHRWVDEWVPGLEPDDEHERSEELG